MGIYIVKQSSSENAVANCVVAWQDFIFRQRDVTYRVSCPGQPPAYSQRVLLFQLERFPYLLVDYLPTPLWPLPFSAVEHEQASNPDGIEPPRYGEQHQHQGEQCNRGRSEQRIVGMPYRFAREPMGMVQHQQHQLSCFPPLGV